MTNEERAEIRLDKRIRRIVQQEMVRPCETCGKQPAAESAEPGPRDTLRERLEAAALSANARLRPPSLRALWRTYRAMRKERQ